MCAEALTATVCPSSGSSSDDTATSGWKDPSGRDRTTFEGKAPGEAVRACAELGVRCLLFGGRVEDGVDAVALSGDPARAAVDLEELGARFGRS